jgi:hypothetical protein
MRCARDTSENKAVISSSPRALLQSTFFGSAHVTSALSDLRIKRRL